MYYHASSNSNIKDLEPRISNHNIPLIYFSSKIENTLVYLSNSVEKFCKETNFNYDGIYSKWGPYSFTSDGKLQLEEYYPNAIYETYNNVSGYIYSISNVPNVKSLDSIPYAYITSNNTKIDNVEYIEDAYKEIMKEEERGSIKILKYEDLSKEKLEWIKNTIEKEYIESINHPEYQYFLKNKFSFLEKSFII